MCWLRIRNIDRDGRFSASGNIHHRTVVFMMAVRNSITKPFLKNNTWAYHHATSFLFFHLNSPRAGAFSSWWWKQKIIIINFFLNYWMYSSSDTTRASLPMQMPHPSLFLLLLLLFILIVWNNAASYIPLVIYYIAQGQTLLRKMCVGGSKSVQAKLCSFIYFFSAARACHRFTTVTLF